MNEYTWNQYFMTMAYLVSMKSKDPSTRVGAVIVGPDREIRATGYNGLPRGVQDKPERYHNREYKYLAVNHAEENAILHCVLTGVSARGCTLYTPWIPCSRCSKAIIQAGIKKVVYDANFPGNDVKFHTEWELSTQVTKELLQEAGVVIEKFSGSLIKIQGLCKEQPFDLKML